MRCPLPIFSTLTGGGGGWPEQDRAWPPPPVGGWRREGRTQHQERTIHTAAGGKIGDAGNSDWRIPPGEQRSTIARSHSTAGQPCQCLDLLGTLHRKMATATAFARRSGDQDPPWSAAARSPSAGGRISSPHRPLVRTTTLETVPPYKHPGTAWENSRFLSCQMQLPYGSQIPELRNNRKRKRCADGPIMKSQSFTSGNVSPASAPHTCGSPVLEMRLRRESFGKPASGSGRQVHGVLPADAASVTVRTWEDRAFHRRVRSLVSFHRHPES